MIKTNTRTLSCLGILLTAILCFSLSCTSYHSVDKEQPAVPRRLRQIAVMPFFIGDKPENVETFMTCQVGRLCTPGREIPPGAAKTMTDIMYQELFKGYADRMVPLEKSRSLFDRMTTVHLENTPLDLAIRFGRELNAGYVVVGNILRFSQRSGGAVGSDYPASVAFNIHLVDADRGARVWKGTFDKTQQPLSENLLTADNVLKEGRKWLTAEELARTGVREVLKSFPLTR